LLWLGCELPRLILPSLGSLEVAAAEFVRFLAIAKRGKAATQFDGGSKDQQEGELTRSITYLRDTTGLGVRALPTFPHNLERRPKLNKSMTEVPALPSAPAPRRVSLSGLLDSVGVLAGLATILAWVGPWFWLFELASQFRVQLAGVFAGLLLIQLLRRRWRLLLGGLVLAFLANAGPVLWAIRPTGRLPGPDGTRLRVLSLNVNTANRDFARVRTAIETSGPDLLLLQEVDQRWMAELAPLERLFPHRLAQPRDDNFGLALWSRHPIFQSEALELAGVEVPSLVVTVTVAGHPLRVLATHLLSPGDAEDSAARNQQLRAMAE